MRIEYLKSLTSKAKQITETGNFQFFRIVILNKSVYLKEYEGIQIATAYQGITLGRCLKGSKSTNLSFAFNIKLPSLTYSYRHMSGCPIIPQTDKRRRLTLIHSITSNLLISATANPQMPRYSIEIRIFSLTSGSRSEPVSSLL